MKVINQILKEAGYTKEFLLECERTGRCNGAGGKGGIQWTDKLRKLDAFDEEHEQELLVDLDLISDIHDIEFEEGGGINTYLKSNYDLICRILQLLHWTNMIGRLFIFIPAFFSLNILGIRYYSFTCFWTK